MITNAMREILIDHLDGTKVPFVVRNSPRLKTTRALLIRGFLRNVAHHTVITESGREALAAALGDWADALIRVRSKFEWPFFAESFKTTTGAVLETA